MTSPSALQYGTYYHIYNRGVNRESIFREERNYPYFLRLYARYIEPVAETYAYCLLSNHFHLLVRIRDEETLKASGRLPNPSRQFSNLFNAYAKAINKAYERSGSLFQHPFGRVEVTSDAYFVCLVAYIHHNPQKHRFVDDFREWPYSSYQAHLSQQATRLKRDEVLEWFQGREHFAAFHQTDVDTRAIAPLIAEDFD